MQVHYDEGIANRIDPEPCAGVREGAGEASAGGREGQPLSRDNSGCRRCLCSGRQHAEERHRKRLGDPAWSKTLAFQNKPGRRVRKILTLALIQFRFVRRTMEVAHWPCKVAVLEDGA